MSKPVILFTTPIIQYPAAGGPFIRIENSIKALSKISNLYIYSRVSLKHLGGQSGLFFYQQYCQDFYFAPCSIKSPLIYYWSQRLINFIYKKITKKQLLKLGQETEIDFNDLLKTANLIQADLIWLGYGNISYPLLKYLKSHSNYKIVLDTDSVWSRFVLRGLPYAKDREEYEKIYKDGQAKAEEENWGTKIADVTTAVSEVDAEYYRSLIESPDRIHLFSNVIDTAIYEQVPPPITNLKKPCIYLAGSFGPRSPMDDAARWLILEVLPLVRKQIPDIHFYIIGNGSETTLSDIKDPNITITGKLTSVLPYLCHTNVALVPLRFESGTRFKILEAGACGIPVVSTTLGAEGIPVTHEENILIADEPTNFAQCIVRLIKDKDLANKIAKNLKTLVQEKYSVNSLVEEGYRILEYLKISYHCEKEKRETQ